MDAALSAGADILITGSIAYTPVLDTLYECSLELSLMDVASRSVLSTWSVSLRGDFSTSAMNSLMINEVIKPVRTGISKKILSDSPGVTKKTLCVEGVSDYITYQSMINSLKATEGVIRVSITSIHGHSICHIIEIKAASSMLWKISNAVRLPRPIFLWRTRRRMYASFTECRDRLS